jgi:hypothetical protein
MLSRREGHVKMPSEYYDPTFRFKPYDFDGQSLTHFRDGYTFALGHGQCLQFPTDKQSSEKRSERGRSSHERYEVCLIGPPFFHILCPT